MQRGMWPQHRLNSHRARSFLRIGAIIMMVNDFVDLWFEAAKARARLAPSHTRAAPC